MSRTRPAVKPRRRTLGRVLRRPPFLSHRAIVARWALLVGLAGLSIAAVVTASAVLAVYISPLLAGIVLGAGCVGMIWTFLTSVRQLGARVRRAPGRSLTLDCRQARWASPPDFGGQPHPPPRTERRVRCRGSRHA